METFCRGDVLCGDVLSSLPSALFAEPAFLVRIEEGVHQIVAIIFGDLERLRFYTVNKMFELLRAVNEYQVR
jgi:hypothetical protein